MPKRDSTTMNLRTGGFSLIEVVLALVVFSMAITVLTQAFVNILLSLESLETETGLQADLRFVRSQIIKEPDLEVFLEGGEVESLRSGTVFWNVEVEPTEVVDLFSVHMSLEFNPPEGGDVSHIEENMLLLRPTWSDPVERSDLLARKTEQLQSERSTQDWY